MLPFPLSPGLEYVEVPYDAMIASFADVRRRIGRPRSKRARVTWGYGERDGLGVVLVPAFRPTDAWHGMPVYPSAPSVLVLAEIRPTFRSGFVLASDLWRERFGSFGAEVLLGPERARFHVWAQDGAAPAQILDDEMARALATVGRRHTGLAVRDGVVEIETVEAGDLVLSAVDDASRLAASLSARSVALGNVDEATTVRAHGVDVEITSEPWATMSRATVIRAALPRPLALGLHLRRVPKRTVGVLARWSGVSFYEPFDARLDAFFDVDAIERVHAHVLLGHDDALASLEAAAALEVPLTVDDRDVILTLVGCPAAKTVERAVDVATAIARALGGAGDRPPDASPYR